MNVQSNKYFSEIKAKNIFFTNYNDNSNIDYEHFLVPLKCALYVLEEKDEKKNIKKDDKKDDKENIKKEEEEEEEKEKAKNVIKKKITFSKNNINNISNKKEKIEVVNNYDKKESYDSNHLENDELKIGYIIKKYNKFIDMILFIVKKNSEVLNNEKIHLLNLFNKTDKDKYFKMLCTKETDYIYWKQFNLEPPMIKISKLLDGKINIINKNPYTIYLEKCK
jgi:hypothetical protein